MQYRILSGCPPATIFSRSSLSTTLDCTRLLAFDVEVEAEDTNNHLTMAIYYRALYDFQGDANAGQISFRAGAIIEVPDVSKANVNGWAAGVERGATGRAGWFPLTYVQPCPAPAGGAPPAGTEGGQQSKAGR